MRSRMSRSVMREPKGSRVPTVGNFFPMQLREVPEWTWGTVFAPRSRRGGQAMRVGHFTLAMFSVAALLTAGTGCASSDEWATWKSHPTHFASGSHMGFSFRNRETGTPRVNRQDIAL